MRLGFFKKNKAIPEFKFIENSDLKNLYFYRVATWDWLTKTMIHVACNHAPRMITMDAWPQQIFIDATGEKTIKEYIYHLANLYSKNEIIPQELDQIVLKFIDNLINERIIEVSNEPRKLPYYLKLPRMKQNNKKAIQMMISDGFIKE